MGNALVSNKDLVAYFLPCDKCLLFSLFSKRNAIVGNGLIELFIDIALGLTVADEIDDTRFHIFGSFIFTGTGGISRQCVTSAGIHIVFPALVANCMNHFSLK